MDMKQAEELASDTGWGIKLRITWRMLIAAATTGTKLSGGHTAAHCGALDRCKLAKLVVAGLELWCVSGAGRSFK